MSREHNQARNNKDTYTYPILIRFNFHYSNENADAPDLSAGDLTKKQLKR